jgi:hypothetical protein
MQTLDIRLPENYTPSTVLNASKYFSDLFAFLASPLASSFIHLHPNDVAKDEFQVPDIWKEWWEWSASGSVIKSGKPNWQLLVEIATSRHGGLRSSISTLTHLTIRTE